MGLREKLRNPEFDEEYIKTVCVPVVPLAMWCRSIGVYLSRTKFKGGPQIRPLAAVGATSGVGEFQDSRLPPVDMIFEPDLGRLSPEELRRVPNLTISRPDVGRIMFHGETDCTDIAFEHIV